MRGTVFFELRADSGREGARPLSSAIRSALIVVELVSGTRLQVDHTESLVFHNGVAVHLNQEGISMLFDHQGVAQLVGAVDVASNET